jgi:phage shock protein C
MNGKIYRSRSDKFLGGVCGGLGQYLGVDSSIVRIIFLLLLIGSGIGFLLYLLLWVILPLEGGTGTASVPRSGAELEQRMQGMGEDIRDATRTPNPKAGLWFGAALIIFGGILFLDRLNIPWLAWVHSGIIWPVLIIFIGIAFLYRGWKRG